MMSRSLTPEKEEEEKKKKMKETRGCASLSILE